MTHPARITSAWFEKSILTVLSSRTSPGQLIKLTDELGKDICRASGIDPDNLEQYGTAHDGWYWDGRVRGEYTATGGVTNSLFRRMQIKYAEMTKPKKGEPMRTIGGSKGFWGLTDSGIAAALKLNPTLITPPVYRPVRVPSAAVTKAIKPARNATSLFLDKRLREPGNKLLATMKKYVAKSLPVSATLGIIEDHVNNCIVQLIHRDALKGRLEAGLLIPDHHIATWAVRSAYKDIRNAGTEPVTREIHGARTERERKQNIPVGGLHDPRVMWNKGTDESTETTGAWLDIEDTETSMSAIAVEDAIQFDQVWGQITSIIRSSKREDTQERYIRILKKKAQGMSVTEIAAEEGVSPHRATSLIAEARRTVQARLKLNQLRGS